MQITLEGHGRPIPAEAGDTVLASLLRAGVPFPFAGTKTTPPSGASMRRFKARIASFRN
jgi:hypothetical protein